MQSATWNRRKALFHLACFARNSSWNWGFKCHRDSKSTRRLSVTGIKRANCSHIIALYQDTETPPLMSPLTNSKKNGENFKVMRELVLDLARKLGVKNWWKAYPPQSDIRPTSVTKIASGEDHSDFGIMEMLLWVNTNEVQPPMDVLVKFLWKFNAKQRKNTCKKNDSDEHTLKQEILPTRDCSSHLIADFFVNQTDSNISSLLSLSRVTERVMSTVWTWTPRQVMHVDWGQALEEIPEVFNSVSSEPQ